MIKACIVGAGGFGGANIIELLAAHPEVEIVSLVDVDGVGEPISNKHTHLKGFCDLPVESPEQFKWDQSLDVAFSATPDGVGMKLAKDCHAAGIKLIDYSGDFRFNSKEAYEYYACRIGRSTAHSNHDLLSKSAYGLAELHREEIASASIIGNPGCFAVSAILGFAPAIKAGLINIETLICDSKTGVSGAGIKPNLSFHYPMRYENMNAYKIAAHQHNIEVERELSLLAGTEILVTLTTQLVPLTRGIMSTIYGRLNTKEITAQDLYQIYTKFYKNSKFIRVEASGTPVSNNDVRGSNYCVISTNVDSRTNQMIVVCHIDNLMKGQAGSALQNMNIMFGLAEDTGLRRPPQFP